MSPATETPAGAAGPAEQRSAGRRPVGLIAFLAVLGTVAVGYTVMAFGLEWRTTAGRIGPGFFPRIVGSLTAALCLVGILRALRPGARRQDDVALPADGGAQVEERTSAEQAGDGLGEGAGSRTFVATMLVALVAMLALIAALVPLGAVISSALFLFGLLALLNPGRWVLNAVISVLLPIGLFVLFQTWLNAGLPEGPLPL